MEKSTIEEMQDFIKAQEKEIAELKRELGLKTKLNEIHVCNGATPMTYAELVTRDCDDIEWLEDIIYYIQLYIDREKGKRCENKAESEE